MPFHPVRTDGSARTGAKDDNEPIVKEGLCDVRNLAFVPVLIRRLHFKHHKHSRCLSDLKGALAVRLTKAEEIPTNQADDAKTFHYAFEVDEETHPADFRRALAWQANRKDLHRAPGMATGFYRQARSGHVAMVSPAGTQTDPKSGRSWRKYALLRPNGTVDHISEQEFAEKYEPVSATLARAWWDEAFARIPKMRTRELHLIGGAVLGVWRNIQSTGAEGLEVLRVPLDNGGRMVGIEIPNAHVAEVLKALGVGRELVDPKAIFAGVVEQGEEVQLAGGLKLRRTMVHREPAFEIADAPSTTFAQLRGIPGVIEERIDGKLRFFIPTDPAAGQPVLDKLIAQFPVLRQTTGGPHSLRPTAVDPHATETELLAGAEVEHRPADNYVALNWQARKVLGALLIKLGGPPRPWDAVTLPPARARRLADLAESAPSTARHAAALRQAAATAERVILLEVGPHLPDRDEALREERFHRAQLLAGGGPVIGLSRLHTARLILDKVGLRISRTLEGMGYRPEEMAWEIAAHAARGPAFWSQAGIIGAEAHRVLELYFALIEREHGEEAAEALRTAAPNDFDATGHPLQHAAKRAHHRPGRAGPNRQVTGSDLPDPDDQGGVYSLAPAARALEAVAETHDEFRKVFHPTARGDSAQRAAFSLREKSATAAREYLQAEHALAAARVWFAKQPWQESLDFINRVEGGERQPTEQLQQWADTVRAHLDLQRDVVRALGTGKAPNVSANPRKGVREKRDDQGKALALGATAPAVKQEAEEQQHPSWRRGPGRTIK